MTSPKSSKATDHLAELLTVTDHFQLERIGLVVVPDFVPPARWEARLEPVVIVTPDGQSREVTARLAVWHFNVPDPARADGRWRLVVSFPTAEKEQVPIGSKVMVSQRLKAAIAPGAISN
jgi:hypothetical protein